MRRTKEEIYKWRKERREKRRAAGECTRCGVPLNDFEKENGLLTCQRCRDKWRLEYYPTSTRGLSRRPSADRGRNHDCWVCGAILPEGYTKKKCEACIEKSRQGLLATNEKKRMEKIEKHKLACLGSLIDALKGDKPCGGKTN